METNNEYTHELRHHNYKLGNNHSDRLEIGTYDECFKQLQEISDYQKVGTGLLLGNCGYSIVNLEEERIQHIKNTGIELYSALQAILNFNIEQLGANNELLSALHRGKEAIKKADNITQIVNKSI